MKTIYPLVKVIKYLPPIKYKIYQNLLDIYKKQKVKQIICPIWIRKNF